MNAYDTSTWSEKRREVLRTPQHLRLFLTHFARSKEPFDSYYGMLDEVWKQSVGKPELKALVSDIAAQMTDQEGLSLPKVRFEHQEENISLLIRAGILHEENGSISFTHQSLLEFARARAFASGREQLTQFILARQDTLSIRPKLLSIMDYLRAVAPQEYEKQVGLLWENRFLRPHVRALMINFLGQVTSPTDHEKDWLRPVVHDAEWRRQVMWAMAGSYDWFNWLSSHYLESMMVDSPERAVSTMPVLIPGWNIDRKRVLKLVENCWLPDATKHEMALAVFQQLESWDEESVRIVAHLLRRTLVPVRSAAYLASLVSSSSPAVSVQWFGLF